MNEIRTLERCGKPAGMAGRPCMRVAGHIGTCIPAMLSDEDFDQLKAETEKLKAASKARHPSNGMYGKYPPMFTRPKIPAVYLVLIGSVVVFMLLQLFIDGYVITQVFKP